MDLVFQLFIVVLFQLILIWLLFILNPVDLLFWLICL